jgi:SpoVK/Ycf46/Vps4 family AAA+-type ATPase
MPTLRSGFITEDGGGAFDPRTRNTTGLNTRMRFVQRPDKEPGNQISNADQLFASAREMAKNPQGACVSAEAIGKLDQALLEYQTILDNMPTRKEGSEIYTRIENNIIDAAALRETLVAEVQNCVNTKVYPTLGQAAAVSDMASGRTVEDSAEDAAIRQRIRNCELKNVCGFRSFENYVGGEQYERFFRDNVINPFLLNRFGSEVRGTVGTMLFGPPGTGKTLLAEAVAQQLQSYGSSFFSVSAATIKGKWVGESEKALSILFQEARAKTYKGTRPVVLFIDEADGLVEMDEQGRITGPGVLSQLNQEMEGLSNTSNKGIVMIIATNYPERIPSAAVSRFVHKIYVGLPSPYDARIMLAQNLKKMGKCRYNLELNLLNGKLRKKFSADITKDASGFASVTLKDDGPVSADDLDAIAMMITCENGNNRKRYAPREIEGLFSFLRGVTYGKARDFAQRKFPDGVKAEVQDQEYAHFQVWLQEHRVFRQRVMNDNGTCGPPEENVVQTVYPIGFLSEKKDEKGNRAFNDCGEYYGSVYESVLQAGKKGKTAVAKLDTKGKTLKQIMEERAKNVKEVTSDDQAENPAALAKADPVPKEDAVAVTLRKDRPTTDANGNRRFPRKTIVTYREIMKRGDKEEWIYRIVGEYVWNEKPNTKTGELEDEPTLKWYNAEDHTQGEVIGDINTILGASQITMVDFEEAIKNVQPTTIRNARKMLSYALRAGRTIEKQYISNWDLDQLMEMAREEERRGSDAEGDDLDDLAQLLQQRTKITGPIQARAAELAAQREANSIASAKKESALTTVYNASKGFASKLVGFTRSQANRAGKEASGISLQKVMDSGKGDGVLLNLYSQPLNAVVNPKSGALLPSARQAINSAEPIMELGKYFNQQFANFDQPRMDERNYNITESDIQADESKRWQQKKLFHYILDQNKSGVSSDMFDPTSADDAEAFLDSYRPLLDSSDASELVYPTTMATVKSVRWVLQNLHTPARAQAFLKTLQGRLTPSAQESNLVRLLGQIASKNVSGF